MSAAAFAAVGDQANSGQRLDQLSALQGSSGLIKGGPDVSWVSTQHNLISYVFLVRLSNELAAAGNTTAAAPYQAAAATISTAINDNLLVTTGSGERRVLAGSPTASDYTVTANATLQSGAGYGIYVRATTDAATNLTGYCVQLDHGYGTGQLVVREILGDAELGVPIAHVNVPSGFAWYGVPHVGGVTVKGNTVTVTLDGAQQIAVADLAAASSVSVKYAYGATSTLTPPTSGGYGMRSWSDGVVTLQQMTVAPPS